MARKKKPARKPAAPKKRARKPAPARRPVKKRLTQKRGLSKKDAFLAAYKLTASITHAAASAHIERGLHYRWLKDDPAYATAFSAAQDEAAQALEDEAVRRAHLGIEEPVIYQGLLQYEWNPRTKRFTKRPLVIRKYSDRLLELLLKAWKPDKYNRERVEHSGPDGRPIETKIEVTFVKP